MANSEHLEILKNGVEEWNKWREENNTIVPNLLDADLSYLNLNYANLSSIDLSFADLSYALLNSANLKDTDLSDANLSSVKLNSADLSYTNLSNAYLKDADLRNANLNYAKLNYANLSFANLGNAILSGADLSFANLLSANLLSADLRDASLNSANLRNANLSYTILRDVSLCNTKLNFTRFDFTNLSYTNLSRADFSNAYFMQTIIGFTDLADCIGLDSVIHRAPSIVDIAATKFNYKNLPIEFLRGCGWSKWQIEAMKLNNPKLSDSKITDIVYKIDHLRNINPIQPYSIFIAYSRKDESFVERIEKKFNAKDIRYWRDVYHATSGPLEKQITNAIHLNPTVLLILSKESVQSEWVKYESHKARELEKRLNRHVICPVALDDSWKTCSWPERLRQQIEEYNILDFSQWQDDTFFEKQFSKLLSGIKRYYKNQIL